MGSSAMVFSFAIAIAITFASTDFIRFTRLFLASSFFASPSTSAITLLHFLRHP